MLQVFRRSKSDLADFLSVILTLNDQPHSARTSDVDKDALLATAENKLMI